MSASTISGARKASGRNRLTSPPSMPSAWAISRIEANRSGRQLIEPAVGARDQGDQLVIRRFGTFGAQDQANFDTTPPQLERHFNCRRLPGFNCVNHAGSGGPIQ